MSTATHVTGCVTGVVALTLLYRSLRAQRLARALESASPMTIRQLLSALLRGVGHTGGAASDAPGVATGQLVALTGVATATNHVNDAVQRATGALASAGPSVGARTVEVLQALNGAAAVAIKTVVRRVFHTLWMSRQQHVSVVGVRWEEVPWGLADPPRSLGSRAFGAAASTATAAASAAAAAAPAVGAADIVAAGAGAGAGAVTIAAAAGAGVPASAAAAGGAAAVSVGAVEGAVRVLGAQHAEPTLPFMLDGGSMRSRTSSGWVKGMFHAVFSLGKVMIKVGQPLTVVGQAIVEPKSGIVAVGPHPVVGLAVLGQGGAASPAAAKSLLRQAAARYRKLGDYRLMWSLLLGGVSLVCLWRSLIRPAILRALERRRQLRDRAELMRGRGVSGRLGRGRRGERGRVIRALERAVDELAAEGSGNECIVCYENVRCCVFLDCGHRACCVRCSLVLYRKPAASRKCPVCRKRIAKAVKVYEV